MLQVECQCCGYSDSIRGWIKKEDYERTKWRDLSLEEFERLNQQAIYETGKPLVYDPVDKISNSIFERYAVCPVCGHQQLEII